jgi:hypothetical protein
MAICNIIEDPNRSDEDWARISEHMNSSGPVPPEGCRLAVIAKERVITVWDTPEYRDRFLAERLAPAYEAAGRSLDEVTRGEFEVERVVAGDLAGMSQPTGSAY